MEKIMDEIEYKEAKEDWVTGHDGGSMWEVFFIACVFLNSFVLWSATEKYAKIFNYASNNTISNFLLEYMFLIIPNLLSCTLLVDYAFYLNVILLISTFVIIKNSSVKFIKDDDNEKKKKRWESDSDDDLIELSVNEEKSDDKDLAGIVAAQPFLKKPENRFKPFKGQLLKAVKQAFPILTLGFIRLMMVKGVDYQEHASEYGIHWNFFFTLGFLPIFVTICRTAHKYIRFSILGLSIAVLYQIILYGLGLEDYILNAPRTDLISSNKEGICSFWGYLSIFLVALDIGHYILPVDPYYAIRQNRQTKKPKPKKLAMILFSWAILLWLGFIFCVILRIPVSRRIANLSYIFLVVSCNTTVLLLFQIVEIVFFEEYWKNERNLPLVFEAVNSNGLAVFLLANILTGLVNLSIRTLFVNYGWAECILAAYMFVIVAIA
ncbi:3648_t:CDS:2, partial [Cetraspora pellucida]